MAEQWHYGINGERQTPVGRSELLRLIREGVIDPERDHVWRSGMSEWTRAIEVEELAPAVSPAQSPFRARKPRKPPPVRPKGQPSREAPSQPTFTANGPVRRKYRDATDRPWPLLSFHLFVGLAAGHVAFRWMSIILARRTLAVDAMPDGWFNFLHLLSVAAFMGAISMACVALWRNWEILQEDAARTTPVQALGFLFVPFFNLYWVWVASVGLAKDYNRYVTERDGHNQIGRELHAHTPVWYIVFAAAFCLKILIFFLVVSAQLPELMTTEGERRVLTDLEFLQVQFSFAYWNLLGTIFLCAALVPVLFEMFRAVNAHSTKPEQADDA